MQYIEKRNTFLSKNLLHQNHRRSTRPEECAICDFHFSFMGHLFRFKSRKAPQYKIKLCVDNSYPNGGDGARVSLGSVFLENIVALRPLVPLWHFPQLYRFIWKSKAVSDQRLNGVAKRKGNGKSWRPLKKAYQDGWSDCWTNAIELGHLNKTVEQKTSWTKIFWTKSRLSKWTTEQISDWTITHWTNAFEQNYCNNWTNLELNKWSHF